MSGNFFTFGEILWDCLPSGRHAGGAPFNVAAHLAQLGIGASLISTVGQDALGDELLQVAKDKGVRTRFVNRARAGLATGRVMATLDASGNATYEIVQPAAWDEIRVSPELVEEMAKADALIFGSLAGRSPYNLDQLELLLAVRGPLKYFDVNLRPPFVDAARVIGLAKRADIIKLNHDEVELLAAWVQGRPAGPISPGDLATIEADCRSLAEATETTRICVTLAAEGAALWEHGKLIHVPAPAVTVKDTVGAGDAFMAGLVVGLTRGIEARKALETACLLGAFVASHDGATPVLSEDLRARIGAAFGREEEIPATL